MRAVRRSLADLKRYLEHEDIRLKHLTESKRDYDSAKARGLSGQALERCKPVFVDLLWLKKQLDCFEELGMLSDSLLERYEGGVVYAVKILQDDISFLSDAGSMGITAHDRIMPNRIVGRVHVPFSYAHCFAPTDVMLSQLRNSLGFLPLLRKKATL